MVQILYQNFGSTKGNWVKTKLEWNSKTCIQVHQVGFSNIKTSFDFKGFILEGLFNENKYLLNWAFSWSKGFGLGSPIIDPIVN